MDHGIQEQLFSAGGSEGNGVQGEELERVVMILLFGKSDPGGESKRRGTTREGGVCWVIG